MARRRTAEVEGEGQEVLGRALQEALGGSIEVVRRVGSGPDLIVSIPGGTVFAVEVKSVANRAEPAPIANALQTWDAQLESMRHETGEHVVGVVVAGVLPEATKAILRDHGWGWLDQRGELDLRGPGLVLHSTDIAPSTPSVGTAARDPIRARAGITTASLFAPRPRRPTRGTRDRPPR